MLSRAYRQCLSVGGVSSYIHEINQENIAGRALFNYHLVPAVCEQERKPIVNQSRLAYAGITLATSRIVVERVIDFPIVQVTPAPKQQIRVHHFQRIAVVPKELAL